MPLFVQNHMVEKIWVEINGRVNYPIKTVLVEMEETGEIDLSYEHAKFCVSWCSMHVAHIGSSIFVAAWNEHHIPGIATRIFPSIHVCAHV